MAALDPKSHYDRVTRAWTLLLGDDLHYGFFAEPDDPLPLATRRLTERMIEAARIEPGIELLDVGCGTGGPACQLAATADVRVTGITTSAVGVEAASMRATATGLDRRVRFELRDGTATGFPAERFERVWLLESSHLMRDRARMFAEAARVLKPEGRLALCDIVLRKPLPFAEVRRLRAPLDVLRKTFGDARMAPLSDYRELAEASGLIVDRGDDLTAATRPTFQRWRENAERHRRRVVELLGEPDLDLFVEACGILERFWDDGILGYALLAARKEARR